MKKLLSLFLITLSLSISAQTKFFVRTSGDDAIGDGSLNKPWKTIYKANSAAITSGTSIDIGEGVFEEENPIVLNSGVSITGAGIDKTFLSLKNPGDATFNYKKFLFQLVSSTFESEKSTLSGFTINGNTVPQLSGGIVISNRENITIQDIKFDHISWGAMWIGASNTSPAKNILLDSVTFLECGMGTSDYASGAIMPAWVENLEIKNFNIKATESKTGYGITAIGYGLPRGSWKNVKIHDGIIDLKTVGSWNYGQAPNISIEVNRVSPIANCEVYNNVIKNNISMVGQHNTRSNSPSIRVHHNTLSLYKSSQPDNYALELSLDDFEFDNNYITGSRFLIAGFYETRFNTKIHHNIFRGGFAKWGPCSFYFGKADSLYFYNNIMDWSPEGSHPGDESVFGIVSNQQYMVIKNNIFLGNTKSTPELIKRDIEALQVSNNIIVNITFGNRSGVYENNITENPEFIGSGDLPVPFYSPINNCNIVDAGSTTLLPSVSYSGSAPDIGSYEYNMIPTEISNVNNSQTNTGHFTIYPNPVSKNQLLRIKTVIEGKKLISITNITGTEVYKTTVENADKFSIQIPNLSEGCYFVNFRGIGFNESLKLHIK